MQTTGAPRTEAQNSEPLWRHQKVQLKIVCAVPSRLCAAGGRLCMDLRRYPGVLHPSSLVSSPKVTTEQSQPHQNVNSTVPLRERYKLCTWTVPCSLFLRLDPATCCLWLRTYSTFQSRYIRVERCLLVEFLRSILCGGFASTFRGFVRMAYDPHKVQFFKHAPSR